MPDKNNFSSLIIVTNILLELFAGIVVGGVLGKFIDSYFKTSHIFFIIFLIIGFISGIINVYRYLKKYL